MTTAGTTKFCTAKIEYGGEHLHIDGNSKITAGNGSFDDPKPNAFSLLPFVDCPDSTPTCRKSCYVHGLKKHAPEVFAMYEHNSATIRRIVDGPARKRWAAAVGEWITEHAPGGFRWHVSGDVFSWPYALFIVDVCRNSPRVSHWIYTRSMVAVGTLTQAKNLAVNISADADNYAYARLTARAYGLRICYLATDADVPDDLPDGSVIFPDYPLRGYGAYTVIRRSLRPMICMADYIGKSESVRCGVCKKCMLP